MLKGVVRFYCNILNQCVPVVQTLGIMFLIIGSVGFFMYSIGCCDQPKVYFRYHPVIVFGVLPFVAFHFGLVFVALPNIIKTILKWCNTNDKPNKEQLLCEQIKNLSRQLAQTEAKLHERELLDAGLINRQILKGQ